MHEDSTGLIEAPRGSGRVLGRFSGERAGPTLIVMAGIHGNEPAGVEASRRLIRGLDRIGADKLRGEVCFVVGNLPALDRRARFIDLDLNRAWTPDKVLEVVDPGRARSEPAEHRELRDVLATLRERVSASRGRIYFIDLHTSSAEGPPFLTVGDTLRNRRFARRFPLPLILGLEEQVDGALLEYLNNFGFVTMGVEAGQHDSEASIDRHEAVLWLALLYSGLVEAADLPELEPYRELLRGVSRGVPRVIEVRHRHAMRPGDRFEMVPGYENFQPIRKGQLMAHDRSGPLHAPEHGLVLLPLYQGLGDDGFFVSREVRSFWLSVSTALRRLRLNRLIHLLPGVRQDPDDPELLVVDTRIARYYPLEIFHLFGFRKRRVNGDSLLVSRRRFDLHAPPRIAL